MYIVLSRRTALRCCAAAVVFCMLFAAVSGRSADLRPVSASAGTERGGTVMIIDPGHGGLDGGAVGINGVAESGLNLAIAQKLEALAGLFGVETVMTRESEELAYPDPDASISRKKVDDQHQRVSLINSVPDGALISIHQNKFTSPGPSGAHVFYRDSGKGPALAARLQELLNTHLVPGGRRVAAPVSEDIYLMNSVHCDAVLVECGFLSNPDEAERLTSDGYQTKLAMAILCTWQENMA